MKTYIAPDHVQEVLLMLSIFFREEQPTLFQIRLTAGSAVQWDETALWQLRTKAPDGMNREAIFPSIEGIIIRCALAPHTFTNVVMCNLLLPWLAVIEQSEEELSVSFGE